MAPLLCMMITLMIQVSCHIEKKVFSFCINKITVKYFLLSFTRPKMWTINIPVFLKTCKWNRCFFIHQYKEILYLKRQIYIKRINNKNYLVPCQLWNVFISIVCRRRNVVFFYYWNQKIYHYLFSKTCRFLTAENDSIETIACDLSMIMHLTKVAPLLYIFNCFIFLMNYWPAWKSRCKSKVPG